MIYKQIPGSDLTCSSICLGTGSFGTAIDEASSWKLLDTFVEAGGNFIDTANVYGDWVPGVKSASEKTIGKWLKLRGNRDNLLVATKGAHPELSNMHISRISKADIVHDLDASLTHLGTDVIDLYWLHRDDQAHPVGDILETLNEQVTAGKIRYFGCSNWTSSRIREALNYASKHGLQGFVGNQMMWSLARVNPTGVGDSTLVMMDEELEALHTHTGLAAIPYSSQANGFFNKMHNGNLNERFQKKFLSEENNNRYARVKKLAEELSLSITELVLGYLMSQPFITIPIIGCKTIDQLKDSLQAADLQLDQSQVNYLQNGA
ncbi:MAG: aldo/keto reductase [Bacilli bacterium]|nr:aldo/keto reductase [Bacilli bacterium]